MVQESTNLVHQVWSNAPHSTVLRQACEKAWAGMQRPYAMLKRSASGMVYKCHARQEGFEVIRGPGGNKIVNREKVPQDK